MSQTIGEGISISDQDKRTTWMVVASYSCFGLRGSGRAGQIEWCRVNYDGTIYVDWDIVPLVLALPVVPFDYASVQQHVMAKLLIAGRGHFPEATLEESDRCARETAKAYNAAKAGESA